MLRAKRTFQEQDHQSYEDEDKRQLTKDSRILFALALLCDAFRDLYYFTVLHLTSHFLPSLIPDDSEYETSVNTKSLGDGRKGFTVISGRPDLPGFFDCQFTRATRGETPLPFAIIYVVNWLSKEEVVWVYTEAVVALVADIMTCGDFAISQDPRHLMGAVEPLAKGYDAIIFSWPALSAGSPNPTTISFLNLRPESLFDRYGLPSHRFEYSPNALWGAN